jgi:hypothetical protein
MYSDHHESISLIKEAFKEEFREILKEREKRSYNDVHFLLKEAYELLNVSILCILSSLK